MPKTSERMRAFSLPYSRKVDFERDLPVAAYSADKDGNLISTNKAAQELFGYSYEEARGLNIISLIKEEDRPTAAANYRTTIETGAISTH